MPTVQNIKVYENGQWVTKALYFPPSSHDHPNYLDAISSLDLRISEIEKNGVGGGSGGVSVAKVNEIIESYLYDTNEQATLPSTGQIDYIYFNQFLTKEEVVEILSTLDMIAYDENNNYYRAFYGENGNYLDIFYDTNENIYSIKYGSNTIWNQANNNGFTTNSININDASILLDWATGVGMSVQNVKLTDLISNAPFYKNSVYALATELRVLSDRVLALENNSDGVTVEEVEEIVESYIYEKEPIAVPSSGEVKTVYFNTDLTPTEVDSYLSKLTYVDFDGLQVNVLFSNATLTNVIFAITFPDEGIYQIIHSNNIAEKQFTEIYDFSFGWNYDKWEINDTGITEAMGISIGAENDIIKDVVNIGYEKEEKYLTKAKANEVVESYLFTEGEPTAVPNEGYVDKVYFNTSLTDDEILNLVKQLSLMSGDLLGYIVLFSSDAKSALTIFINNLENPSIFIITAVINEENTYVYDFNGYVTNGEVNGWNTNITYPLEFNVEVVSEKEGISSGTQNDLIKDLVYVQSGKQEKYTTVEKVESYLFEESTPTTVPNDGSYIDTIYVNTNLSVDEYLSLVSQLTYSDDEDQMYCVSLKDDETTGLVFFMGGAVLFDLVKFIMNGDPSGCYFAYIDGQTEIEQIGFSGWNPNFNGEIKFDGNCIPSSEDMGIGLQNDLIKNLLSTTPFRKQEVYTTPEKVESYLHKEVSKTVELPAGGVVGTIYFKASLKQTRVDEYLSKLTYVDFDGLQVNVLFSNATLTNVIFAVKLSNNIYQINHSTNITEKQFTEIYNTNNGWAYDRWEINDTGITESMGISIGAENYLIKDIVNIGNTLIEEEKYVENVVIEKYVLSDTPDKWGYINFTFEDVAQIFNSKNCTLNLKDKKSNSGWFLPLTCKIELDSANKAAMFSFRYFNLNGLSQNVTVTLLFLNGEIASITSIEDSGGGGGLTEEQADAKYATKSELSGYATKSSLSTYATKTDLDNYMTESDVLQEIENYMTTHYENGNEGSY